MKRNYVHISLYSADIRDLNETNKKLLRRIERLERLFVDFAPEDELKANLTKGNEEFDGFMGRPLFDGEALHAEVEMKSVIQVKKYLHWGTL